MNQQESKSAKPDEALGPEDRAEASPSNEGEITYHKPPSFLWVFVALAAFAACGYLTK